MPGQLDHQGVAIITSLLLLAVMIDREKITHAFAKGKVISFVIVTDVYCHWHLLFTQESLDLKL